jgi:enoyl-CoA hydratase/carnithine racemase
VSASETSTGRVLLELDGPVARILIDNPRRMNAMSLGMWETLADHARAIATSAETRVVLLRGVGGRSFISGADISEFESHRSSEDTVARYNRAVSRAQESLQTLPQPAVAAIEGVCMGGGIGVALACDLRVACEGTRFRMAAGRLGLGYGIAEMRRLVEVIGAAHASDIFMTARVFESRDAATLGLVNAWHPKDQFDEAVARLLDTIVTNAPLTLRAAKLAIAAARSAPDDAVSKRVADAVDRCFASHDYIEGRRAFLEKRPPRFSGA